MSAGWCIKTFDKARWDVLFSGNTPAVRQKVLDALLWDEDNAGFKRDQAAQMLARHVAETGLVYDGLDPLLTEMLDELVRAICTPESFGRDLYAASHSPDPCHMSTVRELLDRLGGRPWQPRKGPFAWKGWQLPPLPSSVRYLPLLLTGRRCGTDRQPSRHHLHVVLSPAEVDAISEEVQAALDAPMPMPDAWYQENIAYILLTPLHQVIESGRWAHMRHS
jgi:hypothetical protein